MTHKWLTRLSDDVDHWRDTQLFHQQHENDQAAEQRERDHDRAREAVRSDDE